MDAGNWIATGSAVIALGSMVWSIRSARQSDKHANKSLEAARKSASASEKSASAAKESATAQLRLAVATEKKNLLHELSITANLVGIYHADEGGVSLTNWGAGNAKLVRMVGWGDDEELADVAGGESEAFPISKVGRPPEGTQLKIRWLDGRGQQAGPMKVE